jgi:hypothetical protein
MVAEGTDKTKGTVVLVILVINNTTARGILMVNDYAWDLGKAFSHRDIVMINVAWYEFVHYIGQDKQETGSPWTPEVFLSCCNQCMTLNRLYVYAELSHSLTGVN